MHRIRLIHWNSDEAKGRSKQLSNAGYEVDYEMLSGMGFLRELSEKPPSAVIIDLTRLPSQGRDMALSIRMRKPTRYLPLVFVGGDPDKVSRIRELLPDAVYTSWKQIDAALEQVITHPPVDPVVPRSTFDAYAGKPLAEKLGIKANSVIALVGAPEDFKKTLGDLPAGSLLQAEIDERCDLIIWFTCSRQELNSGIKDMAARLMQGSLWIAWPKKASKVSSDLTQQFVREVGLAAGMVDYKICSIDATWSGLLFTRRKA